MYNSPPKQSTQQIMPGRDDLKALHEQLEAISAVLELLPAARQMLSDPQTDFQCRLRRNLMRLRTAQFEVNHAAAIVESLLS